MTIYIAAPYSADTPEAMEANVSAAIDAGVALALMGHAPIIPHLSHYVALRHPEALSWGQYMVWDLALLDGADAVLYLGSSPGADIERQCALNQCKMVYYSLEEVPCG